MTLKYIALSFFNETAKAFVIHINIFLVNKPRNEG